jgi:AcrR family transcriptional regulator
MRAMERDAGAAGAEGPAAAPAPDEGRDEGLARVQAGRPRSEHADRELRAAFRDLLTEHGFAALRLEHVAARAGVGKATLYRRWRSKEELALDVLLELAAPYIEVPDMGDTRGELLATAMHPLRALTETDFGPVIRALLSQIAIDPALGDPFRAKVVAARRAEVERVLRRGIARGDLRPDTEIDVATELLVGPTYFRLMFGGRLDRTFARRVVNVVMHGFAAGPSPTPPGDL